jgi:anti-sigma B factor antagonist
VALDMMAREVKDVTVLDLSGKIILGKESQALRERIKELLEEGQKKILLNMAKVKFVDSTGVGTLVSSFTSARGQGGELKLVNLSEKLRETLLLTRLYTVFEVYEKEDEAVRQFQ